VDYELWMMISLLYELCSCLWLACRDRDSFTTFHWISKSKRTLSTRQYLTVNKTSRFRSVRLGVHYSPIIVVLSSSCYCRRKAGLHGLIRDQLRRHSPHVRIIFSVIPVHVERCFTVGGTFRERLCSCSGWTSPERFIFTRAASVRCDAGD